MRDRLVPPWLLLPAMLLIAVFPAPAEAGRRSRRSSHAPHGAPTASAARKSMQLTYPATRRDEQTDEYHGTQVADPYRWLEDLDSRQTRAWVQAQNEVTFAWLGQIGTRERIRQRLTQLWNYERYGLPHKRGGRYFYTRNDGLQNQSAVYVIDKLGSQPRMLLDPNTLSSDGTIALANWFVSDDGRYLAYGLAAAGSDWQEWHVLDVASGRKLSDHLKWLKFSRVSWLPDGSGLYYSRYDEPPPGETYTGANYYQKLYFHKLGDPQAQDTLIYERPDEKEWGFDGDVTEDGRYLIISIWRGTERKNQVFYKDLQRPDSPVVELIAGWDAEYHFIGNDGPKFWFVTDKDAPLRRVIAVDTGEPRPMVAALAKQRGRESIAATTGRLEEALPQLTPDPLPPGAPERAAPVANPGNRTGWKEVIPESNETLQSASVVGEHFVLRYLKDATSAIRVHDLTGKRLRDVELPGLGSAGGFGGRKDDPETFYSFTSFTAPGSIYRYDVATGKSTLFREPKVDFDPSRFETRQVFYHSKDGTRVPLMIVSRKGLILDGCNPTILYGYGGFNVSQTPNFAVSTIAWLEMGGVYAVANLRGGGEYGRAWHEAGMLDRKQNVFDDFIAAAEWLIDNKYTSPQKLAIRGGSNGGLLVGAAMTQRPELFAAAVPAVGVMDMLRYHKFTIGWAWVNEYGSSDDSQQLPTLLAYSPLHNLKPGTHYPATLITTGDHDDRVVPAHSYKFAAALQASQAARQPTLIRIETRAGHGAGTPTTKLIDAATDVLAFLSAVLQAPAP
ncbi:MAG TPA: prolyl oligopeptidase family serine peptidase [Pirellulaceae bacterium]|nr:prolyl oligopeptidase family serine peptidase [Pirellulaceae bacterium]